MKRKLLGMLGQGRSQQSAGIGATRQAESAIRLEQGIAQKAVIELVDARESSGGVCRPLRVLPLRIEKGVLVCEIQPSPDVCEDMKRLASASACRGDFLLASASGAMYCSFASNLLSVRHAQSGVALALLAAPERVDARRREAFRLQPEPGQVLLLEAWAAKTLKAGQERDQVTWGRPLFAVTDNASLPFIQDLSAGGMRLAVSAEQGAFEVGRKFLFKLTLADADTCWFVTFTLFAVVRKVEVGNGRGILEAGLQFVGHARGESGFLLFWERVPEGGVPVLSDWVFKRNLELCRRRVRLA